MFLYAHELQPYAVRKVCGHSAALIRLSCRLSLQTLLLCPLVQCNLVCLSALCHTAAHDFALQLVNVSLYTHQMLRKCQGLAVQLFVV